MAHQRFARQAEFDRGVAALLRDAGLADLAAEREAMAERAERRQGPRACQLCGRALHDPVSIDLGLGRECRLRRRGRVA